MADDSLADLGTDDWIDYKETIKRYRTTPAWTSFRALPPDVKILRVECDSFMPASDPTSTEQPDSQSQTTATPKTTNSRAYPDDPDTHEAKKRKLEMHDSYSAGTNGFSQTQYQGTPTSSHMATPNGYRPSPRTIDSRTHAGEWTRTVHSDHTPSQQARQSIFNPSPRTSVNDSTYKYSHPLPATSQVEIPPPLTFSNDPLPVASDVRSFLEGPSPAALAHRHELSTAGLALMDNLPRSGDAPTNLSINGHSEIYPDYSVPYGRSQ